MNIAILGFGTVGKGVYDGLKSSADLHVVAVLDRARPQETDIAWTKDITDIVDDPAIDAVVECLGGVHPAYEYSVKVLKAHKNLVTSNKALVSAYYQELTACAQDNDAAFCYGAAVGGGIPWISNLRRGVRSEKLLRISGIVNGTSNYILDQMEQQDQTFASALRKAQELGYAEADPHDDIAGIDSQRKCLISAALAFGVILNPLDIPTLGIARITETDIAYFKAHGWRCRLFMQAGRINDELYAYVEPRLCPVGSPEAANTANHNRLSLTGAYSGELSFSGQGAGAAPTGNTVIQDLLDIRDQLLWGENNIKSGHTQNELIGHRYYLPAAAVISADLIADRDSTAIITKPLNIVAAHKLAAKSGCFMAAFPEEI